MHRARPTPSDPASKGNKILSGVVRIFAPFALIVTVAGCATSAQPWGQATTIWPGWQTYGEAAKDAIADPHTWIPLIGAGIFATGDLDKKTTRWAVKKDLFYDNTDKARDASDDLMFASRWLVYATALATPSGDEPSEWFINKSKGLIATTAIIGVGDVAVDVAKQLSVRERPDGSNDESFPSAHAMRTSFRATLAARNIEAMPLETYAKRALQGGAYFTAGLTSWLRLEGNKHYPSDVLVGYSLGHFFGAFLNDAFITPNSDNTIQLDFGASSDSWQLGLTKQFD